MLADLLISQQSQSFVVQTPFQSNFSAQTGNAGQAGAIIVYLEEKKMTKLTAGPRLALQFSVFDQM